MVVWVIQNHLHLCIVTLFGTIYFVEFRIYVFSEEKCIDLSDVKFAPI